MGSVEIGKLDVDQPTSIGDARRAALVRRAGSRAIGKMRVSYLCVTLLVETLACGVDGR